MLSIPGAIVPKLQTFSFKNQILPECKFLFRIFQFFSIKHDLARSCFQLWPIIGDESDKSSKMKINGEVLAETVIFLNLITLGGDYLGSAQDARRSSKMCTSLSLHQNVFTGLKKKLLSILVWREVSRALFHIISTTCGRSYLSSTKYFISSCFSL